MGRDGDLDLVFIQAGMATIMNNSKTEALSATAARAVMAEAKLNAPVRSGAYRNGIGIQQIKTPHRTVYRVVATAPHSMKVESLTGNLARSVKRAKGAI